MSAPLPLPISTYFSSATLTASEATNPWPSMAPLQHNGAKVLLTFPISFRVKSVWALL